MTQGADANLYKARYWKDPEEFKPERFLGDYNKDAFVPFAVGARACLGRRWVSPALVTVIHEGLIVNPR